MEDLSRLTCLLKGFYSALNFLIDPFCLSLLEHIQEGIPEVSQPKSEIPGQSIIGNSWYWPTQIGNSRKGLVQFKNSRLANFGISCFGLAHFRNSRFGWLISGIPHLGRLVSGIPDLVLAHQKIFWKNVIFWHVFHSYESLFGFLLLFNQMTRIFCKTKTLLPAWSRSSNIKTSTYEVTTAYSTNENPRTDKLSRAINQVLPPSLMVYS